MGGAQVVYCWDGTYGNLVKSFWKALFIDLSRYISLFHNNSTSGVTFFIWVIFIRKYQYFLKNEHAIMMMMICSSYAANSTYTQRKEEKINTAESSRDNHLSRTAQYSGVGRRTGFKYPFHPDCSGRLRATRVGVIYLHVLA